MKIFCFWLAFLLFLIFSPDAGMVRTLYVNDQKMEEIYLSLGRSTILRFPYERPEKVVLGNQNYYKLEFIGNDITIQPQDAIATNLFVYTKYRVYGFLLIPHSKGHYDDLVNVRWKTKATAYKLMEKEKDVFLSLKVKKIVRIGLDKKLMAIDLEIGNLSGEEIKTQNINIYASRGKKRLSQRIVFESKIIQGRQKIRARIFLKIDKRRELIINLHFREQILKMKIPKDAL